MEQDTNDRIAVAALLIWSGNSYGDYMYDAEQQDFEPISEAEWTEAEQYEDQLQDIIADHIRNQRKAGK